MSEKAYRQRYVTSAIESLITEIGKYIAAPGDDKKEILLLEKYVRAKKLKLEKTTSK